MILQVVLGFWERTATSPSRKAEYFLDSVGFREGIFDLGLGFLYSSILLTTKVPCEYKKGTVYVRSGLNSHYLHIIRDKLINPLVYSGLYTHYKDFRHFSGGMSPPSPTKRELMGTPGGEKMLPLPPWD